MPAIDLVGLDLAILGENFNVMYFAPALDPSLGTDHLTACAATNRLDRLCQRHAARLERSKSIARLILDMLFFQRLFEIKGCGLSWQERRRQKDQQCQ